MVYEVIIPPLLLRKEKKHQERKKKNKIYFDKDASTPLLLWITCSCGYHRGCDLLVASQSNKRIQKARGRVLPE